jgi:hypothetical protein
VINQQRPFLRWIQLNWSVLARIISLASRRGGRRLLLSLTSIRLSSVAGELLDEVLQWPRSRSIPADVDPGFLAQNQTQQCFKDIATTWLTFANFAARIESRDCARSLEFFLAARLVCQLLLAPLFDYE